MQTLSGLEPIDLYRGWGNSQLLERAHRVHVGNRLHKNPELDRKTLRWIEFGLAWNDLGQHFVLFRDFKNAKRKRVARDRFGFD